MLPTSYTLSSRHLNIASDPFASGGYGDAYEGILDGSRVCIKRVRVHTKGGPEAATRVRYRFRFCSPFLTQLADLLPRGRDMESLGEPKHRTPARCHYHSLPARLRVDIRWGPARPHQEEPQYGSTWTRKDHSCCDYLVSYLLHKLADIAGGLCYLHSRNVVHGNLKGVRCSHKSRFTAVLTCDQTNVLIDNSGRARVTEFGLAKVTRSISQQHVHTGRWAAPEVLNEGPHSKEADIFSFAMVMIEVRDDDPLVENLDSLLYCTNIGIHRCGSVQ